VFPIIGGEVGAKEKVREKSKETEKEKEQYKDDYGDIPSRLRANDTLPPLPPLSPLPAPIHSTTTATGKASIDVNIKSKRSYEDILEGVDVAGREEAIIRLSGMIDPPAVPQSTFPPILAEVSSSVSSSGSAAASASSPPLHPLDHPLRSTASTTPADQAARAARNSFTPISTSTRLDADSVSVTSSVLEAAASTTETDSSDVSPPFASSDLILSDTGTGTGKGTGTSSGVEVMDGRGVSRDVSSVGGQGMDVEAVAVVEEVVVVEVQGSARRKYSYSDEELDEEDNIDDIALAPSSALDKKKAGQASRDFPYHPAFQPVFSIVEKDKTEGFTPDSYYDQFKNEKQFFLEDKGSASDIDNDDADEEGMQRSSRDSSNEKRVETAAAYVRRVMGELRQEAVFREIDDSPRRGIMESIWEEIKDAEAMTVSSLSDLMEDKEDEEEEEGDEDVEVYDDDDDDENDDDDIEDD
jgi:hypothetical protein